jgi:DNA-binding transcriptional regulator PaaX
MENKPVWMTELNADNCRVTRGRNTPEVINVGETSVRFSLAAMRKMGLVKGDRLVFRLTAGVMSVAYDKEKGFNVSTKKDGNLNVCIIHNTELARSLRRLGYKRMMITEFADGSYMVKKIN